MQHSITPKNQALNLPKRSVLAIAISSALTSTLLFSAAAFAETKADNLPQVDVNAQRISDTKPVKGYNAKKAFLLPEQKQNCAIRHKQLPLFRKI